MDHNRLEDHFVLGMFLEPRDNLARLFEWPGVRLPAIWRKEARYQ
jgi:hypothetical protein